MKLAFCLFKYFPYGGLQRDFYRIALACRDRGHEVHVYTMYWEGERDSCFNVHLMKVKGWQNHTRNHAFAEMVHRHIKEQDFDLVVGFNKLPNLDIYYTADVCFQARLENKPWFYRVLPRYRRLLELEKAVFARGQPTEIMLLAKAQQNDYVRCYQTELERFHLLPPGIAKDRIAPLNATDIRHTLRLELGLTENDICLLMVGSGFKTKGLDRSLNALSFLPQELKERCQLFVIGQDNPKKFLCLAASLGVKERVHFLGGRPDVPRFLLAADLLLHPSYHENTGTALLEALVAGLPVLTVDVCGYAHFIEEADAGKVITSPFEQNKFNDMLQKMLLSPERPLWRQHALAFAKQADIYSLPDKAADLIEAIGRKK